MTRKKRGAAPRGGPICEGNPGLLLGPGREKSRARRCPFPSSGEGRLHNFVRESCSQLRLLLLVLPRPPPAPLLESEGGALLGQPATPGRGSRLPTLIAQPRSRGSLRSDPPSRRSRDPGAPRPENFVLPERPVSLGSGFGPAPAWEATTGRAHRTWRFGSPDRAPGQSALALSALPARSHQLRAVRGAGIPEPAVRAGSQKLD